MPNPTWSGSTRPDIAQLGPLDALQAYDAMCHFIEAHWERGLRASDDIAKLLSMIDRSVWADGGPGDPAMWEDWVEALDKARDTASSNGS